MLKENTQELLDKFVKDTDSKGALITNDEGLRLYTNAKVMDDSSLDKVAAMIAVSDSIYTKLNKDINGEEMEMSLIVSKSEIIVLKHIFDSVVFLTHYDRSKNSNEIYNLINTFVETLKK